MRSFLLTLGAVLGGLLAGFLVFELAVRLIMQLMDAVPIALIGTLANVLPLGGAIAAVVFVHRRKRR